MNHRNTLRQSSRAFTVVEILVTIGVLLLVAVGVSTVFTSISETVASGKRVAELNRFAAQLERVMRRDFENITHDGFLVIAQQTAPGADPDHDVQLWPGDSSDANNNNVPGRPRRIDEIMFFSRGEFESARRAIASGMLAKSTEAAIYYGHGQKRRPDLANTDPEMDPILASNLFFNPRITDSNFDADARLGVNPPGIYNPNQYASDWSLLRQVTLLIHPQSSGQQLPDEVYGVTRINADRQWLEDSRRQIALQPATRSIFNSLTQSGFSNLPVPAAGFNLPKWYRQYPTTTMSPFYEPPAFRASGLVDIATVDLAEIRTTLSALSPSQGPLDYWNRSSPNLNPQIMEVSYDEFADLFWEQSTSPNPSDANSLNLNSPANVTNARAWMLDALPSLWNLNPTTPVQLSRVRYEDIPTRILYDENAFANNDIGDRQRVYAEADQEMLASSVFVPQCTEFIVEWSYGFIDPAITDPTDPRYKKMIWYGLDRWVDANNDGLIQTLGNGVTPAQDHRVAQPYNKRPPASGFEQGPDPQLVVGHFAEIPGFGPPRTTEIAAFGYPDYNNNDWPWPKFIRVTISIADPKDRSLENTFQMIFNIPDASTN